MYAKIFRQIYDSTLADNWQALITFEQLLILADYHGEVDMTLAAIHRITGIPLEHIEAGIKKLIEPDPQSRSPEEEGRRIVPIDPGRSWGWIIVNFKTYRAFTDAETKREQDKQRARTYRDKKRHAASRCVTPSNGLSRHTDTDLELKIKTLAPTNGANGFLEFYKAYPRHISPGRAEKAWKKIKPDEPLQQKIMAGVEKARIEWKDREKDKIPYPATWLNDKGWENEYVGAGKDDSWKY